jgi:hypothetical protein
MLVLLFLLRRWEVEYFWVDAVSRVVQHVETSRGI